MHSVLQKEPRSEMPRDTVGIAEGSIGELREIHRAEDILNLEPSWQGFSWYMRREINPQRKPAR